MSDCLTAVVEEDGTLRAFSSDAPVAWWSFTKTLLAAAVLRLAERQLLALDDRVRNLPFTPRQLLRHRAGVGDYGALAAYHEAVAREETPWPDDEVLRRVPPERLLFPPDTGWSYSNVGYLLLRRQVEEISGSRLGPALGELVLRPLGLERARVAETAQDMAEIAFTPAHRYHPGWVLHGCVIGPVSEAALALHRLLTGNLLAPPSREAMLDLFPLREGSGARHWVSPGYGLGVMMGTMQRPGVPRPLDVVGHSAGGPGSAGAVYHCQRGGERRTAAVFVAAGEAADAEEAVLRLLGTAGG